MHLRLVFVDFFDGLDGDFVWGDLFHRRRDRYWFNASDWLWGCLLFLDRCAVLLDGRLGYCCAGLREGLSASRRRFRTPMPRKGFAGQSCAAIPSGGDFDLG